MYQDYDRPVCHPRADDPLFIAHVGYEQQRLIPLLLHGGVRMTVSPLYYMAANPELALFTGGRHSLGLALDPCVHHRQMPLAARSASFRSLPYGSSPRAFDPDHDAITADEFVDLAITPLELQRERGATLMLTSAHLAGAIGTRGRELDLRLARAGIAHFRGQRMDEPPEFAANPCRREIYAVLVMPVRLLRSESMRSAMCAAYLQLAADGFWVKLDGFDERAARVDIRAGGAFLAEMRDDGRPVVACQPGQLHLGLLADGFSASVGLAEGEHFRFPTDWKQQAGDIGERRGRRRSAYHPKYLRSFQLGGDGATRAFAEAGCPCKRHPPREPPAGHLVEEHAAVVRCQQARDALDGETADRREWLFASAAMASHLAHDAGVESTLPVVFEELFAGLDRDDEQRRQAS